MADSSLKIETEKNTLDQHISLPPVRSILGLTAVFFLFFALFTGLTYQFYASLLFLFYSFIKSMWFSVVCLGVFQTILMIPFRIVNLRKAVDIKEFEDKIEGFSATQKKQHRLIKQSLKEGNVTLLWYIFNFFTQIISYFSIGRLFLTDFYTKPLNPKLLYSFIPYPEYPIRDTFFKIPYLVVTKTFDFGMDKVLIFWAGAIIYKVIVSKLVPYYRKKMGGLITNDTRDLPFRLVKNFVKQTSASLVLLLVLGWLLIRFFPIGWQARIFSGDVSRPNRRFNTITAITTFFIIIWLDLPKIREKIRIAKLKNISRKVVKSTQMKLFKDSFQKAIFLGLGAYFITNMIPCAFELSIFTLELISLLSPFTLDKAIFKVQSKLSENMKKG